MRIKLISSDDDARMLSVGHVLRPVNAHHQPDSTGFDLYCDDQNLYSNISREEATRLRDHLNFVLGETVDEKVEGFLDASADADAEGPMEGPVEDELEEPGQPPIKRLTMTEDTVIVEFGY